MHPPHRLLTELDRLERTLDQEYRRRRLIAFVYFMIGVSIGFVLASVN